MASKAKVFIVKYPHQAEHKVFFVDHDHQESNAQIIAHGELVKYEHQADVKVFIVKYKHLASICIKRKNFPL
jgi:hypothetical protein